MCTERCDDELESLPLPKGWSKTVRHAVLNVVGLVRVAMLAGREIHIQNGDVIEARVQREPFFPLAFHDGVGLSLVELNDLLLIAMHPSDENHKEELTGLKNEVHGGPHVTQKNLTMSPRAPSVN